MERSYNTEWLDKLKGLRLEGESKPGPVGRPVREYLSDTALFRAWGGGDLEFKVARLLETGGASVMRPLDRNQVLKFCQNPEMPTLGAFAICMAWGGQRMDHYRRCFERPALLVGLLEKLRKSEKSRLEDFALADGMQIPGLGVSFLTKLLFFLRPRRDAYILDQWIAKSLKLLVDPCPIRLAKWGGPHAETSPLEYEEACQALEEIGGSLGGLSGDEAEQLLFSSPAGAWRREVQGGFSVCSETSKRQGPAVKSKGFGESCPFCELASKIVTRHLEASRECRHVPISVTPAVHHLCGRPSPCRVYCGRELEIEFYYHINNHFIRAGAFFPKKIALQYHDLKARGMALGQDFWGPVAFGGSGKTISLSVRVVGEIQATGQQLEDFLDGAVDAMEELYGRLDKVLYNPNGRAF
jgi:hypothetical protein